jgi:alpha-maltose-1-phosphate synthase
MNPKTLVVCNGRFHHFDLAKQLHRHGMLERLFTSYPAFKLRGEDLPAGRVTTFPWIMTPRMALARWGVGPEPLERCLNRWAQESLDRYVASHLPECDVVIALSGSGLRVGRCAQRRGGRYVCDRGSSHIRYQDAILREEFSRWGDRFVGVDPKVMAKEEREYESADVIAVPSEFVRRSFVEMGVPAGKLRKVPYGVDLRRFERVASPATQGFDVLFVGQVSFRKGIPDLLHAFEQLRHPRKRLRIVGGVHPEIKHFLARHPAPSQVEFLGLVAQYRLKELMSRSHVMVLPSVEEGLALVQAQAMACGCPVVATYHTGAEDLFTDGLEGFIVAPRDPKALADRLQLLAEDPVRREEMSEAALQRVKALGGWNQYGDAMVTTLRELVGDGT